MSQQPEQPVDEDIVVGTAAQVPGPSGTGELTDAGADPAADGVKGDPA